jgi:hypothetical protein
MLTLVFRLRLRLDWLRQILRWLNDGFLGDVHAQALLFGAVRLGVCFGGVAGVLLCV